MTDDDLKLARSLIKDKAWTRIAIAAKIGVSHMTLYRELKRGRAAIIATRAVTRMTKKDQPKPHKRRR